MDLANTPRVQYAYTTGDNNSRLTSIVYPNGRTITYNYLTSLDGHSVPDSAISRLTSISDGGTTLEQLSYLGLGTVVQRDHPEPGVKLTYIGTGPGDAGDKYVGLDRFDRIVDQRWEKGGTDLDRFQYGYDRNSNRLYQDIVTDGNPSLGNDDAYDELYHANGANGYDNLNQIKDYRRGRLTGTPLDTVTTSSKTLNWGYDEQGNWDSFTTDGSSQDRTHNKQNEVSIDGLSPAITFDANGNLTKDDKGANQNTFTYDAWNRLVKTTGNAGTVTYAFDALGRRIIENPGTARDLYFSAGWQVVEERISGTARVSYVWSPVYIDAMIAKDRDADSNGSLEERLYIQHDANFNITAVTNASGAVQQRYAYEPFGKQTILTVNWVVGADAVGLRQGWQGLAYEAINGTNHGRGREWIVSLGRWVQGDPDGFRDSTNLFQGFLNSPVNMLDPTGRGVIADFNNSINIFGAFDELDQQLALRNAIIELNRQRDGTAPNMPLGAGAFEKHFQATSLIQLRSRVSGVFRTIQGGSELMLAGLLYTNPVTRPFARFLLVKGLDDFQAGPMQVINGGPARTVIGLVVKHTGKLLGMNEQTAEALAEKTVEGTDLAAGFGSIFSARTLWKRQLCDPKQIARVRKFASKSNADIVHSWGPGQKDLLNNWMGTGVKGARDAMGRPVPQGLGRETLEGYLEMALRQIETGLDTVGTQQARLELIELALSNLGR